MAKRKDNVIMFPKQSKFNIATIILLAVLVYMAVCIYSFFSKEHIVSYEVREGVLVGNSRYEAVVLRNEQLVKSKAAGYVNYFLAEREKVGVGNLIYTLDESGTVLSYLEAMDAQENSLDKETKDSFRDTLDDFVKHYDRQDMSSLYQLNNYLTNQTQKIANTRLLGNLNNISSASGLIQYYKAEEAGNLVYWMDGLEELSLAEVTSELFDKKEYEVTYMTSNQLVTTEDVVYKLYDSEKWSIAFPIEDTEKAQQYLKEEVVEVHFLKNDITLWGTVSLTQNTLGETVVCLDFQSGSINFAMDRFVEIEIVMEDEEGLKIPVSAIAQKEFFLIPQDFVTYVEDEAAYYIYEETYSETGVMTLQKYEVSPASLKEEQYYLDDINISLGTRLVKSDSSDSYVVTQKGSLTGVYNINKGYADFKQITVKQQNDSYAIVASNTQYGLNVYDYIVLNANAVSENDFVYD